MRFPHTKMGCEFGIGVSENTQAVLRCDRGNNLAEGGGRTFLKKFSEGGGELFFDDVIGPERPSILLLISFKYK